MSPPNNKQKIPRNQIGTFTLLLHTGPMPPMSAESWHLLEKFSSRDGLRCKDRKGRRFGTRLQIADLRLQIGKPRRASVAEFVRIRVRIASLTPAISRLRSRSRRRERLFNQQSEICSFACAYSPFTGTSRACNTSLVSSFWTNATTRKSRKRMGLWASGNGASFL